MNTRRILRKSEPQPKPNFEIGEKHGDYDGYA